MLVDSDPACVIQVALGTKPRVDSTWPYGDDQVGR